MVANPLAPAIFRAKPSNHPTLQRSTSASRGLLTRPALPSHRAAASHVELPADARPLVRPLASVMHALERLTYACPRVMTRRRPQLFIVIFGGGTIGTLHCLALRRCFPFCTIEIVESDHSRREVLKKLGIANAVHARLPAGTVADAAIVACPSPQAALRAIEIAKSVLLCSSLDAEEMAKLPPARRRLAQRLDQIHAAEEIDLANVENNGHVQRVGAKGETDQSIDDATHELGSHLAHYARVGLVRRAG
jgi:threonine dehydrogenase-like Zn-dependent dehydrogenase